jgi:hypothetical protein
MPKGLVFASRSRSSQSKNNRRRRSARARRTARRRNNARRLHFFGVLKRSRKAQRGGNYAYQIPDYATRDYQSQEDDGFTAPIMVTQEEAERMAAEARGDL